MDKLGSFWDYLSRKRNEDDFVDRLYYKVTPRILLVCALIIFAKEYGGNPIQCWAPADWIGPWTEYANDYCFVEGTYYLNVKDRMPDEQDRESLPSIKYYTWIAFLFAFQAFIFHLPYFMWSSFNRWSGLEVRAIVSMAYQAAFSDTGLSMEQRLKITEHMYNSLEAIRNKNDSDFYPIRIIVSFYRKYIGKYFLVALYLSMKVLFLFITVWQLQIISSFLGHTASIWDYDSVLQMFHDSKSWEKTAKFPRIGMCQFEIRELEMNVHKHSPQCVLMANMINEKIFMAVWFWYWVLIVFGLVNLVYWLYFLLFPTKNRSFVLASIVQGDGANEELFLEESGKLISDYKRKLGDARELVEELNTQLRERKLPVRDFNSKEVKIGYQTEKALKKLRKQFQLLQRSEHVYNLFLEHIGLDTILMFRLMEINSSAPVVNEIMSQLFFEYMDKHLSEEAKEKYFKLAISAESVKMCTDMLARKK